MRTTTFTSLLALTLALTAILVGGCGESKADKASDQVCSARDDIAKQVDTLKGLTLATATTSQVSESLQAIKADLSTIAKARGDLSDEKRKAVESANAEFSAAVKQIASSAAKSVSLQESANQFKQALAQLGTSYRNTFGKLDC